MPLLDTIRDFKLLKIKLSEELYMYTANDIINLKEVVYHQGSWNQHTSIVIEGRENGKSDVLSIKNYAKMLTSAISDHAPSICHVAQKETENSFSVFQLVEKICIAGHFSNELSSSNVEIFSPHILDIDKILRVTRDFFNCDELAVTTFSKGAA
jgi:hypothetical protein